MDLGSSRVRASLPGLDVIVDLPSSVGAAAGRPPSPDTVRVGPIRYGAVTDVPGCIRLTRRTLREIDPMPELSEVLLGVPVAADRFQRHRAATAVQAATDCPVHTMQAPLAAAAGAGLDIADPRPRLVMDIGAGIIETVVIARARVLSARSIQYDPERVAGRPVPHLSEHLRERLAVTVHQVLGDLPSQQRVAARKGGLLLTGGGARMPSLPGRLTAEIGLTISVARDPSRATIRGLARICLSPAAWRQVVTTS
ncbi:rod shape-determining protein [Thermomonospora echinospora]|uniref:rod shape-determining protein n=1 Tax=Thermomonospora echinospora TaxID=1992 RepID=UPI00135A1A3C|nr:rod shape-determining protein [Thermomonospora echinospora]